MNSKDFDKRKERLFTELRQSYEYYLVGFEKGWIYNLADPFTKPQVEEINLTEAKSILSKFTLSGKIT